MVEEDRREERELGADPLGNVQQFSPTKDGGDVVALQSAAVACHRPQRRLPAPVDFVPMEQAYSMRFARIVQGGFFTDEFGLPLPTAPGTDNLHRLTPTRR